MAILLKTTPVWVSSIQIMQVRVQNKVKSVWKSTYNEDVSVEKGTVGPTRHQGAHGPSSAPWCLVGPTGLLWYTSWAP